MKLYLDDERDAPEGWHVIRDPFGLLKIVDEAFPGDIDALSFDHDLGYFLPSGNEITGYWVLCRMEELAAMDIYYQSKIPDDLRIHSANSSAYKKMEQAIESIRRIKNG